MNAIATIATVGAALTALSLLSAAASNLGGIADRLGELAAILRGIDQTARARLELDREEAERWRTVEDHAARGPGQ